MSELPVGWTPARIGKLCSLENGRAFKPTDWSSKGLPIVRIQNLNSPGAPFNYFEGEYSQRHFLRGGELLFAWSGTPGTSFGAHVWRGSAAVLNQHIFRVDFDEKYLDKKFFRYAINQKLSELIDIAHGGVGLRHVTKGKFEATEIVLPPLAEQKRIADKLDALLARVDACREWLDRVPRLLKRFRQAVLAAATSGALTEEWRSSSNSVMQSWEVKSGESVFPFVTSGSRGWAEFYADDGAKFIRVGNLNHESISLDLDDIQYVNPPAGAEGLRTRVRVGDILISITADVGMVAFIHEDIGEAYINQHLCLARQDGSHLGAFLAYYLVSSTGGLGQLLSKERGATKAGLTLGDIKSLHIPIPALEEQAEIVRRVEALFALADRIEARYRAARAQVDKLTPALLAKAFRGELVPQDPNDEPASALLARIQAEREGQGQLFGEEGVRRRRGRKSG